ETTVVAARVAPRLVSNRTRVRALVRRTRRLIARYARGPATSGRATRLTTLHDVYGGAYGRPLPDADAAARSFVERGGPLLDATYSAKAFAAAVRLARGTSEPTLFWLTFD